MPYKLVDKLEDLCEALPVVSSQKEITLDCEGVALSRNGELTLLQVGLRSNQVYLFDIKVLGRRAFSKGLKDMLESPDIEKVIYDCKSDADALYHLHGVTLRGVIDLQIYSAMAQKIQTGRITFVTGCQKACERRYLVKPEWARLKKAVHDMMEANKAHTIWADRPLPSQLVEYAANDVLPLFPLYDALKKEVDVGRYQGISREMMKMASACYADIFKNMTTRVRNQYEQNPVFRDFVIPEVRGGVVIPLNTTSYRRCETCRIAMPSNKCNRIGQKCVYCVTMDQRSNKR